MSDALMDELRARFRETARVRLEEMRRLLDGGRDADIVRHFHALAGMGATYGYRRVSELGDRGESTRSREEWRSLIEEISRELC